MVDECKVCGRTIEQIADELNQDSEIEDFKGIPTCSKCESEYKKAHPNMQSEDAVPDVDMEAASKVDKSKNWKDQVTA